MMDLVARLLIYSIIAVIFFVYAGYPLILFLIGLFKKKGKLPLQYELPSVAMIISAHNEEKMIREKIENSLKIDYPPELLKIIVASDGSVDGTDQVVREYEDRNVVLKSFVRREGKSATLNKSVLGIDEEVILFSDTNVFYRADAVKKLIRNFADENVGCVVGKLVYVDDDSYVSRGESLYWKYEGLLNRMESRLSSVLVATGAIFAIRRELFRPVMKDIANDLQIPSNVASQKYGTVYEGEAIAYERSTYFFREEFNRKRRIIIRGLTGFNHLKHDFGGTFRTFQFVSRKLLRWWIGVMLPVLYAANIFLLDDPLYLAFFIFQTAFYLSAIVGAILRRGRYRSKIFFVPFYFVMVYGATLAAFITYFSGGRLSSWEKAETTRDVKNHPLIQPRFRVIEGKKVSEKLDNLERIT